jgi:C4-dicarboxylate-specific signal transduction histidine kinase
MAGELTASIAHELNQPLGSILVTVETLDLMLTVPAPDVSEMRGVVSDIRRDDQRASQIIQHIRSLAKKTPFESKPLDLKDAVTETLDLLSSLAIARTMTLRSRLAEVPLPVRGDRIQLQQVLLNLIVNAMDATAEGDYRPDRAFRRCGRVFND